MHNKKKFWIGLVLGAIVGFVSAYSILVPAGAAINPSPSVAPYAHLAETNRVALKPLERVVTNPVAAAIHTLDVNDYRTYPMPEGDGDYKSYAKLFKAVQASTGTDAMLLARVAAMESGFRKDAKPPKGTASGLFQFTDDTWVETVAKHGARFGIDATTDVFDPRANALMKGARTQDAIQLLKTVITDREINEVDLYLAHFLGRSGAVKFMVADWDTKAAKDMPRAARYNKNIFYERKQARTYGQIYAALDVRFSMKAAEFDLP